MIEFEVAKAAGATLEDHGCFVLVLSELEDGTGRRLEVQRAFTFDSQDEELGMDTYCLCNEDGATHYGGVIEWMVVEGVLQLALDQEGSAVLDAEGGYRLKLPASSVDLVRETLAQLLV